MEPNSLRLFQGAASGASSGYEGAVLLGYDIASIWLVAFQVSSETGWGTRYSNASIGAAVFDLSFNSTGDYVAVATGNSVRVLPWSNSTGFGTPLNPSAQPSTTYVSSVDFAPDDSAVVCGHSFSPNITAYAWTGSAFGAKFSNPSSLPVTTPERVRFSPGGEAVAIVHPSSPYVEVYRWSPSGFGTKYSNPSTLPGSICYRVAFSPDGAAIVVGSPTAPGVFAYQWSDSTGFGTKYADPAGVFKKGRYVVEFSRDGKNILISEGSPEAFAWDSASGFGARYTDPSVFPPSVVSGAFSTDLSGALFGFGCSTTSSQARIYNFDNGLIDEITGTPVGIASGKCTALAFTLPF